MCAKAVEAMLNAMFETRLMTGSMSVTLLSVHEEALPNQEGADAGA